MRTDACKRPIAALIDPRTIRELEETADAWYRGRLAIAKVAGVPIKPSKPSPPASPAKPAAPPKPGQPAAPAKPSVPPGGNVPSKAPAVPPRPAAPPKQPANPPPVVQPTQPATPPGQGAAPPAGSTPGPAGGQPGVSPSSPQATPGTPPQGSSSGPQQPPARQGGQPPAGNQQPPGGQQPPPAGQGGPQPGQGDQPPGQGGPSPQAQQFSQLYRDYAQAVAEGRQVEWLQKNAKTLKPAVLKEVQSKMNSTMSRLQQRFPDVPPDKLLDAYADVVQSGNLDNADLENITKSVAAELGVSPDQIKKNPSWWGKIWDWFTGLPTPLQVMIGAGVAVGAAGLAYTLFGGNKMGGLAAMLGGAGVAAAGAYMGGAFDGLLGSSQPPADQPPPAQPPSAPSSPPPQGDKGFFGGLWEGIAGALGLPTGSKGSGGPASGNSSGGAGGQPQQPGGAGSLNLTGMLKDRKIDANELAQLRQYTPQQLAPAVRQYFDSLNWFFQRAASRALKNAVESGDFSGIQSYLGMEGATQEDMQKFVEAARLAGII